MKLLGTLLKNEYGYFRCHYAADCLGCSWFHLWNKTCRRRDGIHFYGTVLWRTMLYLHLCGRANGFAPCRIRISGTKNFEAFSSYPCQSGKIAFGRIFDLRYLLHSVNAYLVSCRHVVLENRSTWLFPALLGKLVFNYGIDFEYWLVSWGDC